MPGMSSSPSIFEHIELDLNCFDITPEKKESLEHYSNRISKYIIHPNPVLIGVSFGGIVMQEIAKTITVKKIIIISSVKTNKEFPPLYTFAKKTKIYKLLPISQFAYCLDKIGRTFGSQHLKHRLALYDRYLPIRDKHYIAWCLDNLLNWPQENELADVIHIQGEKDEIFPIKYTTNVIPIKQGTHAMIIIKAKWFTENLPNIILNNTYEKNL